MIFLRPYTEADRTAVLALDLREADVLELKASLGFSGAAAMSYSLEHSKDTFVAYQDYTLIAVGGIGEIDPEIGCPWLLGTTEVDHCGLSLVRLGRQFIRGQLSVYKTLMNFVSSQHQTAISWLKSLGMSFDTEEYTFVDPEVSFRMFYIHRKGT